MAAKVVQWGRRDIDAAWFAEELEIDPWVRGFRPPRTARWMRSLRDGLQLVPVGLVVGLGVVAFRGFASRD